MSIDHGGTEIATASLLRLLSEVEDCIKSVDLLCSDESFDVGIKAGYERVRSLIEIEMGRVRNMRV